MNQTMVKQIIDWSLFAMTLVYLVTGLGITQYRIIESITFGVFSKNLSFRIHEELLVPFLILLGIHVFFRPISWAYTALKNRL